MTSLPPLHVQESREMLSSRTESSEAQQRALDDAALCSAQVCSGVRGGIRSGVRGGIRSGVLEGILDPGYSRGY